MGTERGSAVLPGGRYPDGQAAAQQPEWRSHPHYGEACELLAAAPPLVTVPEIDELHSALARVAAGQAQILQAGDCAESFAETGEEDTRAKLTVLHGLADRLAAATGQPVLRIGRIGGQFAKPRSAAVESVVGMTLPAFRGHMVNSEEPTTRARAHDPRRMAEAYHASRIVLNRVRADRLSRAAAAPRPADGPWSSHDALVLDYETNLVRWSGGGRFLSSTHLPWIGDRTRQPDSAHVQLLASMRNPVACKIGPTTSAAHLAELCARLDPGRAPGRLTLIVRLGRAAIAATLPALMAAVRARGHPVIWLSDPMHGNTIRVEGNRKTRRLDDVVAEAVQFRRIAESQGAHPGGLHLEVAAAEVTECVGGPVPGVSDLAGRYTTLCDPRLNPSQAAELIEAWAAGGDR
jgi:3-deoxy-7-phosphoheptulonate synthase